MGKALKIGSCVGGGGLVIGGGGYAAKKYLDEYMGPYTLDRALVDLNLELAETKEDFKTIFKDLKRAGLPGWSTGIMTTTDVSNGNENTTPLEMERKCKEIMKKEFSEYGKTEDKSESDRRQNELKTIKIVCTKNYTLADNARDYWGDDKTIYSESQTVDENKWRSEFGKFKAKPDKW